MKNSATTLRTLVTENALEIGRVSKDALGEDYNTLTNLYRNGLDALTEWAEKDYAHKSEQADRDNAFTHIKPILEAFATDEDRIIIDQASMRTLRDLATKPKRMYSKEYREAEKARREQAKQANSRYDDLLTLGAPERTEDEETADYVARVRELGITTVVDGTDMLEMYQNALAYLAVKTAKVESIKKNGKWTWRRPIAVSVNEFAELVENYIADCLIDGYNLKSSTTIRADRKAEREAAKAQ
jgi:hypothetical protein